MSNYYITPVTGSSDQLERRCWNENHVPGPRLSSPGEWERKAVIARGVLGSICCSSVQSPTHLSHTTFSIKWEVYFSKELCPLVVTVLNKFLHASAYVLCGYITGCVLARLTVGQGSPWPASSSLRGPYPTCSNPSWRGYVYCLIRLLGGGGNADRAQGIFCDCQVCLSYGSAPGPT